MSDQPISITFQIAQSSLTTVLPSMPDPAGWTTALNGAMAAWDISSRSRVCAFLAQCAYESARFTEYVEDLDYTTAARLVAVYPREFPDEATAAPYVGNPQMIANRVYANRMGNGDESSGDGWTYRGRGLIQLTGRDNYVAYAAAKAMAVSAVPALLETQDGAADVAAWFWFSESLNELADSDEFTKITEKINGGTAGLDQRKALWNEFLAAIPDGSTPAAVS